MIRRYYERFLALPDHIIAHAPYERVFMRVGFALLVYFTLDWTIDYSSQPHPNGLAQWFDLTWLTEGDRLGTLRAVTAIALVFYVAGVAPALALSVVVVVAVSIGTLGNSQGAIGHSTQLVVLALMAQWVVYLSRPAWWITASREIAAIHAVKITIAAGYVVCGLVKVIRSYGLWIWQSPDMALQFEKTRQMEFYNRLEVVRSDSWIDRMPEWIIAHPFLAQSAFGTGLFLELFAFVILLGRGVAAWFGLGLIGMHLSISLAMRLDFETHIALIAIILVNAPYWIQVGAKRAGARFPGPGFR